MSPEESHLPMSDIQFARVLVALDFSEQAAQALNLAITISQMFGSKLFLVHAASPLAYAVGTETLPLEVFNASLDGARERLDQIIAGMPALQALEPKTVVAYAGAVDLISDVARDEKIDLILVGSHGARGLERLALGSVAESVLRHAICPVLIVGPHCKAESEPFRSIVFATDMETTARRGAQYAASLAGRVHGSLTVLHVTNRKFSSPDLLRDQTEDQVNHELQKLLPADIGRYSKAKVQMAYGPASEVIATVAQAESATLVVVGLKSRALADRTPWSTTGHIIRELKCPVLGVPGH